MMILGLQITIPDPTAVQMPDLTPAWAWVVGAVIGWYVLAALLFRVVGVKQKFEQCKKEDIAEAIRTNGEYSTMHREAERKSPAAATAACYAASPILVPVIVALAAVWLPSKVLFWLAGGYQKPKEAIKF